MKHSNDLCFLLLEFPGAATHTVLTDFDDQKLFSRGMTSIESLAPYISQTFLFFKGIIKVFQNFLSPK